MTNEVEVKDLKIDDNGHHLADGMNLCAGCEDVFTLGKYCKFCQAVHDELTTKYPGDEALRVQAGVAPFEDDDAGKPARVGDVLLVFFGGLCSGMIMMTAFWFGFRALIRFCLEHSR